MKIKFQAAEANKAVSRFVSQSDLVLDQTWPIFKLSLSLSLDGIKITILTKLQAANKIFLKVDLVTMFFYQTSGHL